jgi:hypothetical protein
MPDALSYATPPMPPKGVLLEEIGDGNVRITLPPQPVWQVAVGLALGLLLAALAGGIGVFVLLISTRGGVSWAAGLVAVIASVCFGVIVLQLALRARRLPLTGIIPTVIEATPDGLSISTARGGQPEQWFYPVRRMIGFAVVVGSMTLTLRQTMRIVMRLTIDGTLTGRETVAIEFDATHAGPPDRFDAALRNALGLDPSTAAEARTFRWEIIIRRV